MNQGGKISQFEDILAKSGQIGQLLAAMDWNVTSLGSLSTWSQSLRTALNISLTSNLPMILFWGENFVQFYNDAYCLLLGIVEPQLSLGQPASEMGGNLWNCIYPYLETVFTTGETTQLFNQPLQLEQDGKVQTDDFCFSLSPIWIETGTIGGILTTVTETIPEPVNRPFEEETPRKDLLQQLETERARLEAVLQQMPAGVLLADAKSGQLILANKQVSQIIGYAYETESKLEEYDQIVDFEGFRANGQRYAPDEWPLMRSLSTGEVVTAEEIRLERVDGSQVFISVNSAPIRDQQGEIVAAVAIFQDITHAKQVEQAFKESQILFEGFMRHIPAIAYIKDEQGRYIYANLVATQLVNRSLEDIIGQTDFELFPEIASQFQQHDQVVLSSGQSAEFLESITRNGVEFYGMSFKFPITDAAGHRLLGGMSFDITERKRLEDALRVSEAKFNRLVNANIIGVIVCTLDKIVEANDVFLQMVGYTREQLIAGEISWLNLTPPEYLDLDEQGLEELRNTGKCTPFEKKYFHSSGSQIPILIGATLLEENPLTWLCFVLDLTELKQTEKALRSSEERLALASAAAQIGTFEWNIQTNQVFWTAEEEVLYGLAPGQFGGEYSFWQQAVHPADLEKVEQELQQAIQQRTDIHSEFRVIWPDGSLHWLSVKGRVYCDAEGQPLRVIGVNEEITDRKQAEEALRNSEERFRLAAQAVAGIVYDWDLKTNQVYRSKGLYRILGINPEQVPQTKDWWVERIHPDDWIQCQSVINSVFAGAGDRYEFEYRVRHEQGHWITVWDRGYLIRDEQGQLVRVVGSSTDITQRKQAEIEREELLNRERNAREEAEAANRVKDEFLAVLSHELRSPLNPILGWASLLRSGKTNPETSRRALEIIERNAKLQAQLIEDLLDVSRILRGKLVLNISPVSLENAIHAALETVQLAADAKGIRIDTHLEPNVRPVLGDASRLQQMIWNLLSNAVKFTDSGGRVDIYLETVGSQGQVRVQDTGQGITPDFLPHVFEYFRQADSTTTRHFGGLGLGLAIVRYLTELHGGSVWAESPGEAQGATFTLRLPLMMDGGEADVHELIPDVIDLTGIQVLAIDDEADMRELVAFSLKEVGASVQLAASAQEALLLLNESLPDVIICDIGMPEVNGYMFMCEMRSKPLEKGGKIPAIALTAYAGETNQQKALSAGFQMHLAKPIEPDTLVEVIAKLLIKTRK